MRPRLVLAAAAGIALVLSLLGGIEAAAPAKNPANWPGSRYWYRVSISVKESWAEDHRKVESSVYDWRRQTSVWSLASRTAVILYRQCSAIGSPFTARDISLIQGLPDGTPCARVAAELRKTSAGRRALRRLRLVDDVRFEANAEGMWTKYALVHEFRDYEWKGRRCPGYDNTWTNVAPVPTEGAISSGSTAKDGVQVSFRVTSQDSSKQFDSTGDSRCRDPDTGDVVRTGLVAAHVPGTYGGLVALLFSSVVGPKDCTFKVGARFGHTFTQKCRGNYTTDLVNSDVTREIHVEQTIKFRRCPGTTACR